MPVIVDAMRRAPVSGAYRPGARWDRCV